MAKKSRVSLSEHVRSRVRALRAERGMTQEALGEAAGLSVDAVSRIEGGSRVPTLETVDKLARGLGVPVGSLLADTPPPATVYSPTATRVARALTAQPEAVQLAAEKAVRAVLDVAIRE